MTFVFHRSLTGLQVSADLQLPSIFPIILGVFIQSLGPFLVIWFLAATGFLRLPPKIPELEVTTAYVETLFIY
jgi:hypothetical protein